MAEPVVALAAAVVALAAAAEPVVELAAAVVVLAAVVVALAPAAVRLVPVRLASAAAVLREPAAHNACAGTAACPYNGGGCQCISNKWSCL
jgi:hypothetical protein